MIYFGGLFMVVLAYSVLHVFAPKVLMEDTCAMVMLLALAIVASYIYIGLDLCSMSAVCTGGLQALLAD